jgi:hypothetical protein
MISKRTTIALLAAALALLLLDATASARPTLGQAHMKRLLRGETVDFSQKVPGSGVKMGKTIAIVEDAPEAVVYVLLAVDKYKHYIPRIKESRVTKRRGWHTYAVIHTDLPWPAKDAWIYIKSTRYDKPNRTYELKWWMLNGTMKRYTGSALIEPWNKAGTKSVITYKMLAVPKTSAPNSVVSKGLRKVVSTIVNRLRLRLKALRKYKKMPKGL